MPRILLEIGHSRFLLPAASEKELVTLLKSFQGARRVRTDWSGVSTNPHVELYHPEELYGYGQDLTITAILLGAGVVITETALEPPLPKPPPAEGGAP